VDQQAFETCKKALALNSSHTGYGVSCGVVAALIYIFASKSDPFNWAFLGLITLLVTFGVWGVTYGYAFSFAGLSKKLKKLKDLEQEFSLGKKEVTFLRNALLTEHVRNRTVHLAGNSLSKAVSEEVKKELAKKKDEITRVVRSSIDSACSSQATQAKITKTVKDTVQAHLNTLAPAIQKAVTNYANESVPDGLLGPLTDRIAALENRQGEVESTLKGPHKNPSNSAVEDDDSSSSPTA